MNSYKEEILHTHVAIENWLSRGGAAWRRCYSVSLLIFRW